MALDNIITNKNWKYAVYIHFQYLGCRSSLDTQMKYNCSNEDTIAL